MTGLRAEFMYPSQKAVEKAMPGNVTDQSQDVHEEEGQPAGDEGAHDQTEDQGGSLSFFLAILLFSRSGSLGFCTRGTSCSTMCSLLEHALSLGVLRFLAVFLPKIGLHSRSFSGFTTAQRDTTPESELLGSNSLTMSVSMPIDGCLIRDIAAACCCNSPFTDSVDPLNWLCASGLRTTWALVNT
jgi:hypothetical protein